MVEQRTMFYAYPALPKDIAESIESSIEEVNRGEVLKIVGWKDLHTVGKMLIDSIVAKIDEADLFACDLTALNLNVLFELGYAIGRGKRLWISVSETVDPDQRGVRKIDTLVPVGHSRYFNRVQLVNAIYQEEPWEDLRASFPVEGNGQMPVRPRGASLLYIKSSQPSDASIRLSQVLDSTKIFGERTIDDPSEVPNEGLDWYIEKAQRADAVVVHFLSNQRVSTESHNGKCALVSGIAFGLGRPFLMIAHAPFENPIDFRGRLRIHETALKCQEIIESWLRDNQSKIVERYDQKRLFSLQSRARGELSRLSVGEVLAENEFQMIEKYFLETSSFEHLLNGNQTIFVGRKGTGKTANFYAAAQELRRDSRNFVCVIKPISYELDGVLHLLRRTIDRAERGYLVESLWKFLVYTELAASVVEDLRVRPAYYVPSQGESSLLQYVAEKRELLELPFSVRLQQAVNDLATVDMTAEIKDQRSHVSEMLHNTMLAKLRSLLGAALEDRQRVAILIDNLDKVWGEREEIELLAQLLFGLLGVAGRIREEFQHGSRRSPGANVTLGVFLRSDIFSVVQDVAREPDKLAYERITWDDPQLLMRVVDNRLAYSLGETVTAEAIWDKYFEDDVRGKAARSYIGSYVIPRPRDAIYFVRESIARAVNRGHTTVRAEDIIAAERDYSQYAFDALLIEDDPRRGKLEEVLYGFAGVHRVLSRDDVENIIATAGVKRDDQQMYHNLLIDINFLGIRNEEGAVEFPTDESRRKVAQRVAKQIAGRSGRIEEYEVNRVFCPVLHIME